MNPSGQTNPLPCEFNTDKLTLRIDELVASDVDAISPVDKLMSIINGSDCAPRDSFGVETALREALGQRGDPWKSPEHAEESTRLLRLSTGSWPSDNCDG
jgi:hypothetical protein